MVWSISILLVRADRRGGSSFILFGLRILCNARYNALEFLMPVKTIPTFLAKVTANQLLLAPCTLTAVFSWNLICQGKEKEIPGKLKNDLVPTMMNGWKFWIPAASINFWIIPLPMQVSYSA